MWSWTSDRSTVVPVLLREADVQADGQPFPDFDTWCARMPGRRCAVWVSAAHVHELMVDPALPLHGDAEAIDWARAQWMQYHGDAAARWSLATWAHRGRRGVSALHGIAMSSLQAAARTHRVHMVSVRPWWSCALHEALDQTVALRQGRQRLCVVEGTHLTRIDLDAGAVRAVESDRLDGATSEELIRSARRAGANADDEAPDTARATAWACGYGLDGVDELRPAWSLW